MVTSFFVQGNVKKKKKYRENVTYDNLKSHEKPGFHPLSGK